MPTEPKQKEPWDHQSLWKRAFVFVLPRPLGLVHKGIFFWCGFVIAYPLFAATQSVPDADLLVPFLWRGLVFFFALEILLQQAKFLWNDLRDRSTDKLLALHSERLQLSNIVSERIAVFHILVRWGGALVLGGFLSRDFLLVLLLISAHQLLYEWVIKLRAGRHPIVFHVFLCFNLPLRVISGFLCFFDISTVLSLPVLMITLFVFYLLSWSSLSNQAVIEAHTAAGDPSFIRYTYLRPQRWLSWVGFKAYWQHGDTRPPALSFLLPRQQSFFFYENGRRMAALTLFPSIVIVLLLGIRTVPEITAFPSVIVLGLIGLISLLLAPITFRDRGFGTAKKQWYQVLRAVIVITIGALIAVGLYTLATASVLMAMWYLIGYTFLHYLLYLDPTMVA